MQTIQALKNMRRNRNHSQHTENIARMANFARKRSSSWKATFRDFSSRQCSRCAILSFYITATCTAAWI